MVLLVLITLALVPAGEAQGATRVWGVWSNNTDPNELVAYSCIRPGCTGANALYPLGQQNNITTDLLRAYMGAAVPSRAVTSHRAIVPFDALQAGGIDQTRFDGFLTDIRFTDKLIVLGGSRSGRAFPTDLNVYRAYFSALLSHAKALAPTATLYWGPVNEPDAGSGLSPHQAALSYVGMKQECPSCDVLAGEFAAPPADQDTCGMGSGAAATRYIARYLANLGRLIAFTGVGQPYALGFHSYDIGMNTGTLPQLAASWRRLLTTQNRQYPVRPRHDVWATEAGIRLDTRRGRVRRGPDCELIIPWEGTRPPYETQSFAGAYNQQVTAAEALIAGAQTSDAPSRIYYATPAQSFGYGDFDSGLRAATTYTDNGNRPAFCILLGGTRDSCIADTQNVEPRQAPSAFAILGSLLSASPVLASTWPPR